MHGTDSSDRLPSHQPAGSPSEQARLDEAIERADELLISSLQSDERRRVRRRKILFLVGGLAMFATISLLIGLSMQGQLALNNSAPAGKSGQFTQQGWQLWKRGEFSGAAAKFEQAVELAPKNASAWNGLGWSRFNGGEYDDANKAFRKVLALERKHPAALNGLGQLALLQRNYKEAEKYLLAAAPQASAAWWGLTRLYLLQGKFDQARKWAKKIVDSGNTDPSANEMLKAAEAKQLSPELRQKIEPPEKSDRTSTDVLRGWQLFRQGRSNEARDIFEAALAGDPDNGAALNGMGWCLLVGGETAKAKPYFEKVIAANGNASGALNGLARVLKAEGDLDGAIKLWQDMVERFPGPHAGTSGLAGAYYEKGEYKKSVALYEELVRAYPDNEDYRSRLATAKEKASE